VPLYLPAGCNAQQQAIHQDWLQDMARFVRRAAPLQLVTAATEGFFMEVPGDPAQRHLYNPGAVRLPCGTSALTAALRLPACLPACLPARLPACPPACTFGRWQQRPPRRLCCPSVPTTPPPAACLPRVLQALGRSAMVKIG
jgi:hypothetical protein